MENGYFSWMVIERLWGLLNRADSELTLLNI